MHSTTSACTVGHKINLSHAHGATRASSTMDGRRAPPRDGGRRSASVGRARRLARVGRSSASGRSCAAHARARDTHHRPPPNTHTRRRTHTPPDAEYSDESISNVRKVAMSSARRTIALALTLLVACASSANAAITGFCDYFQLTLTCAGHATSAACTGDCTWNGSDCEADASLMASVVFTATDSTSQAFVTQALACTADNNDATSCAADTNCEYDASSGDCSVTNAFTLSKYQTCQTSTSAGERTRVGFVAPATAFVAATALAALA